MVFGATITGAGLADDMQEGHHRPVPVAADVAVGGARSAAPSPTCVNNVIVLVVMALTGLVVGWRIHTACSRRLLGFLLLLVFAYAISWIMAWVGLLVPTPEVVNNASFIVIFPLTFIANTFVPIETLPGPAADLRRVEPGLGGDPGRPRAVRQPQPDPALRHRTPGRCSTPMLYTLIWSAAILADLHPAGQPPVPQGHQPLSPR